MKAIIGRKLGMTQVFDESGKAVPVTVLQAGPCPITRVKTQESDGYEAIQLGFALKKKDNKKKDAKDTPRYLVEFRGDVEGHEAGAELKVDTFEVGDKVSVVSTSKGKGFAGTVKRHNFAIGPKSHGGRNKRKPGSIGAMYPQNVYKGRKMPGHMGAARTTVHNLVVQMIDTENNLIALKGAVPGPKKSIVQIRSRA